MQRLAHCNACECVEYILPIYAEIRYTCDSNQQSVTHV